MEIKSALNKFSSKGFTLIELLIVIAILGVLAAGILVAIDPIDKINQANDSKVQNDVSAMGRAAEAYATTHNGFYPATMADLVTAGELKRVPVPPTGYDAYRYSAFNATGGACIAGVSCTYLTIEAELKSKRFTSVSSPRYWLYNSTNGKSCDVDAGPSICP